MFDNDNIVQILMDHTREWIDSEMDKFTNRGIPRHSLASDYCLLVLFINLFSQKENIKTIFIV